MSTEGTAVGVFLRSARSRAWMPSVERVDMAEARRRARALSESSGLAVRDETR